MPYSFKPTIFPAVVLSKPDSSALAITSTGGGYGASEDTPRNGGPGGSGGGAGAGGGTPGTVGSGNTPPVSPAQGTNGGSGPGAGPGITPTQRAGGGGHSLGVVCLFCD